MTGRSFDPGYVRQCLASGNGVHSLDVVLQGLSRILDGSEPASRGAAADRASVDARLRAVLSHLDGIPTDAALANAEPKGSVVLASLPGDRDTGTWLWRLILASQGHGVHPLGVKAPPLIVSHVAQLSPDALALHVAASRSRPAVQAVVAGLARRGLRVPLIVGGPGVDPEFAQWVAVPQSGQPYWGGVYFCDDAQQMLSVLRQVILFDPPPVAHTHERAAPLSDCAGCGGCPISTSCELQ
ncbi:MAG: hypothetical protein MUF84_12720 [Anaerolineae bacterium]|nr:hypothetical protein [Anaerolineae bacterium]